MEWLDWSEEAFARARDLERPVLLLVRATWCRFSRELEREVLSDERVQDLLASRFVCVRVDKDRRPDIDARYTKDGWPTLAWLDETGELLAADSYLDVEQLCERARLVADVFAVERETIRARIQELERARAGRAERAATRGELSLAIVEDVTRTILESADSHWGGWGARHKFPHPEAIDLALIRWSQTGDPAMHGLVTRTLRNMEEGQIHDRIEGGFYRFATRPDWSDPNTEKMLDSNAQRLFCYLEAYQAFGEESFRETAEGILRWMHETLLDTETRAFKGSQDANAEYANLTDLAERRRFGRPPCDRTIFANWNAIAVSALFKSAAVLGEERHRQQALATLDFLVEELFDPAVGIYHYWDGNYHLPGLLTDQAYVLRALVDAMQFAGENRYLATAERLADLALEHLQSPGGGFYDTLHDPSAHGGLRHRNRSILENSVMAEALLRLSQMAHQGDYADTARDALASFVGDYKRYGHYVAGFARAVDLFFHPPVHVTVVGTRGDERTRALAAAALRPYVASRIVQTLDPAEDRALLERFGIAEPQAGALPRAYVQRGRESWAETDDPARLPTLMSKIERGS